MSYNYDEFNGQSLVFKYNVDNNGNPITVKVENENKQVSTHGTIQLEYVPDEFNRVLMLDDKNKEMVEVFNKDEITPTTYYIDYNNGVAYLDKTQFGKTKIYNYYSRGLQLIGCSRIFDEHDVRGQNVLLTLQEIIDAGKECIRILLNIGDAWQIIQRLERDIAEGRQLILDIEGKIIEARADVDGMLVELEDKKTDCIRQIDEAVQNGMDNIVNVAGNIEIQIPSSAWVLNNGSYEKQITHNLNSEKLHVSAINSDTKEAITIGYKVVDKSNVILKSDENINANIILSASYYNPYLYGNGEIAEEVVAARKGETSLDVKIGKIDTAIAEHSASLESIAKTPSSKTTTELQSFLNNIENNNVVKFPCGFYEIDNVLVLSNKRNIKLDFSGSHIKINKHGYGVLEINACQDVEILGGKFEGHGLFPPNTWNDTTKTLSNEKQDYKSNWGFNRNGSNKSDGDFGNGYLNNCGIGILVRGASKNISVNCCETFGFNYVGIAVGFLGDGNSATNLQAYNENIEIFNCYSHDNFCAGIHSMAVDGCNMYDNRCINNGHYDAKLSDGYVDPGYGITCRSANSNSKNVKMKNNICIGNKRKGIDSHGHENLIIDNNYIRDSILFGIAMAYTGYDLNNVTVKNNYIENCGISTGANSDVLGSPMAGIIFSNYVIGTSIVENNDIINCGKIINPNCSSVALEIKGSDGNAVVKGNNIIESGSRTNVILKVPYLVFKDNCIKFDNSKCTSAILSVGSLSDTHIIKNNSIKGQYNRVFQIDTIQDVELSNNNIQQTIDVARPVEYINGGTCMLKNNKGLTKGGILGVNDTGKSVQNNSLIRLQCYSNGNFGIVGGNKSIIESINKTETNITINFNSNIKIELIDIKQASYSAYSICNQVYVASITNNNVTIEFKKDGTVINPTTSLLNNEQFLINVSYYD